MEEEKTVQENTPEMEVAVETPEVQAESPKHKSNASVSNDSFNWDEFQSIRKDFPLVRPRIYVSIYGD